MKRGGVAGAVALCLLAGCEDPGLPTVVCGSFPGPSGPTDTLFIQPTLGTPPGDGEIDVLVRVDPLGTRGAVTFTAPPPPTAGAVSVAVTTDATFQGCMSASPGGFRLHAAEAPLDRLWIRVSSDRPVVVRPSVVMDPAAGPAPAARASDGAPLVVRPGLSGRARWSVPAGGSDPE